MEAQVIAATPEMCCYCFDVLQHALATDENNLEEAPRQNGKHHKRRKNPSNASVAAPDPAIYELPNYECPLFVGWHKNARKGHKLRGCKGTHGSLPLNEGLRQYSLLSAFDDSRFEPVQEDEVPRLSCNVSLLFAFERADHCYDWEVGKHGIRIDFVDRHNIQRSATFLPHVAVEFGYNQKQTIERLVEKSGCEDAVDSELLPKIKTIRFQDSRCELFYDDYLKLAKARSEKVKRK